MSVEIVQNRWTNILLLEKQCSLYTNMLELTCSLVLRLAVESLNVEDLSSNDSIQEAMPTAATLRPSANQSICPSEHIPLEVQTVWLDPASLI